MSSQHDQFVNCQYANDYKVHFLIGQGGQANVYLGTKQFNLYALKVYNKGFTKQEGFKRQVQFLENLKHPNLISFVQACNDAQIKLRGQKPEKRLLIVLEFAQAQMFEFIHREGKFTPQICRTLFRQLITALKFLDSKGISHRDLKPQNILFDQNFNLKVSDFGLSTFSEGYNKDNKLISKVGTEGYKCPQIQQGKKYQGLHADFFAAGVILFVMYSGSPPFCSTHPIDKIYKLIKDKQFAKFWGLHEKKRPAGFYPDSFKRLLTQFFSYDPTKRPTFQSLQDDQWLKGDTLMGNQHKSYMQARYDKIAQSDEVKKKIANLRKIILLEQQMEQQQCENSSTTRKANVKVFQERVKIYNEIKPQNLAQCDRKLFYFKKDIGTTLAFLKDFIEECKQNKNIFLQNFIQQIEVSEYEMQVHNGQVDLKFKFDIDEQSEQTLKIKGKLFRQGDKVGIDWNKIQGNDFWLSSIIRDINLTLNVLN